MYVHAHTQACMHTHTHTHTCMHVHMHTHITCAHRYTLTTRACTHTHTHTHAHTHTHTHTHTHIHTHTHTHSLTHSHTSIWISYTPWHSVVRKMSQMSEATPGLCDHLMFSPHCRKKKQGAYTALTVTVMMTHHPSWRLVKYPPPRYEPYWMWIDQTTFAEWEWELPLPQPPPPPPQSWPEIGKSESSHYWVMKHEN